MTLPFPIPIEVLYAGLAGVLLSLFIATWQQNWRCSVFFLLALRLAIGWHFLFEGLHKVHSHYTGPNDSTKVFTSEPYFNVAPGPLGAVMRTQFSDPNAVFADRVKPPKEIKRDAFEILPEKDQAEACPESVKKALDEVNARTKDDKGIEREGLVEAAIKDAATKAITAANADTQKELAAVKNEKDQGKITEEVERERTKKIGDDAEKFRAKQQERITNAPTLAKEAIQSAKAAYARWVYGVDARDTKIKAIGGKDPQFTAPERLDWIEWLKKQVEEAEARAHAGLGTGYGYEKERVNSLRLDLLAAETALAKDANEFVAELRTSLTAGTAKPETPEKRRGPLMDQITMWFLVAVGTGLLAGFLCRLWCVLGAGFLIITYLNHPAFPWFTAPPGTEGNPLFINKNIIECLALMALACLPTGRWLGLDALFLGVPRDPSLERPVAAAPPTQPRSLQQTPRRS